MLGQIEDILRMLRSLEESVEATLWPKGTLSNLQRSACEMRSVADPVPRIALVGEFNAGKSTLVNTLVGRDVAAVDLFEMTSWVAIYRAGPRDRCELLGVDSTIREMPLDMFLDATRARRWDASTLAKLERVEIELEGNPLPVSLIDPPGFGSITRENEARMFSALELADLVLWIVDVDGVGSLREVTLIEQLRASGMPLAAVLTKTDLLDEPEEELEELVEFVAQRAQIAADRVFPVSATETGDVGLGRLRTFLESIPQERAGLRAQAAAAHEARATAAALTLIRAATDTLEDQATQVADAVEEREVVAALIRGRVLNEVSAWVRETLLSAERDEIQNALAEALAKGKADGHSLPALFSAAVPQHYLDSYWLRVMENAQQRWVAAWAAEGIDTMAYTLKAVGPAYESQTNDTTILTKGGNPDEVFQTSMAGTLGTATVASAWAAWLGPAAAQVTLGAAVTGVGIPIALMGAGVSYMLARKRHKERKVRHEVLAAELMSGLVNSFADAVTQGTLADAIDAAHADLTLTSSTQNKPIAAWLSELRQAETVLDKPRLLESHE